MGVLILNGSPQGRNSNSQVLIQKIQKDLTAKVIHLAQLKWSPLEKKKVYKALAESKGLIFVTGTYWDSWGSPLQRFLENVTDLEGGPAFLGKPVMVIVLNHSVGGKGVLSRLQGVLSTFGCLIPPLSGMVYSWETQELLKTKSFSKAAKDLWSLQDLKPMLQNFQQALQIKAKWQNWPVDRVDYRKQWLK